ncbi:MAG: hypothetical protein V2A76_04865 [Planctomycetota bacterium]
MSDSPPHMAWQQAVPQIEFSAELPLEELELLREAAESETRPPGFRFDDLLRPEILEAARRQLEETLSEK